MKIKLKKGNGIMITIVYIKFELICILKKKKTDLAVNPNSPSDFPLGNWLQLKFICYCFHIAKKTQESTYTSCN